jgi:hypothetical protein
VAASHAAKYSQALNNGKRVLVVAHSQGNLFTNRSFALVNSANRQYLGIVSVATPANQKADQPTDCRIGESPGCDYVTASEDLVISALPGLTLPPNVPQGNREGDWLLGHSYADYYLRDGSATRSAFLTKLGNTADRTERPPEPTDPGACEPEPPIGDPRLLNFDCFHAGDTSFVIGPTVDNPAGLAFQPLELSRTISSAPHSFRYAISAPGDGRVFAVETDINLFYELVQGVGITKGGGSASMVCRGALTLPVASKLRLVTSTTGTASRTTSAGVAKQLVNVRASSPGGTVLNRGAAIAGQTVTSNLVGANGCRSSSIFDLFMQCDGSPVVSISTCLRPGDFTFGFENSSAAGSNTDLGEQSSSLSLFTRADVFIDPAPECPAF